jgi:acyl-CoA synthetase (AMP-forming)/AMP-acid ligase II
MLVNPEARLIDGRTGEVLAGAELRGRVEAVTFAQDAGALLLSLPISVDSVVRYMAALESGRPVALLDPALPEETLKEIHTRFGGAECHPDLGLLLATSGSTGSPKLVRLSRNAIMANAESIAQSLDIGADEVAITTLPFFYSYGMSVLNSHLLRGATIVVDDRGYLDKGFWATVAEQGVTSLAGVPYQYEMLRRVGFDPAKYPALRTLTQAGGRLRPQLVADFAARMATVGGRLYVMYGQTEAGPRMAVLPPGKVTEKAGSVGLPVPGGRFTIEGELGEVVYHGPNVMMGYAETAADLAKGDELGGVLHTGDLGRLDEDGFLFLTGRTKRIGKVFGVRLNLDDVERMLDVQAAAVSANDKIVIWVEGTPGDDLATGLAERLNVHHSGLRVRGIDKLPLLPNGKVDYQALERQA